MNIHLFIVWILFQWGEKMKETQRTLFQHPNGRDYLYTLLPKSKEITQIDLQSGFTASISFSSHSEAVANLASWVENSQYRVPKAFRIRTETQRDPDDSRKKLMILSKLGFQVPSLGDLKTFLVFVNGHALGPLDKFDESDKMPGLDLDYLRRILRRKEELANA